MLPSINSLASQFQSGVTEPSVPGLAMLTERVNEARQRIGSVTQNLNQIALGLHGPRPEAVGPQSGIKSAESLRGRIDDLLSDIDSLESAVQSLIR